MDTIETARLSLRCFEPEDAEAAFRNIYSDSEVAAFMHWNMHSCVEETAQFISQFIASYGKPGFYRWAITMKENREVIGSIGFEVEDPQDAVGSLSYNLCRRFWGKGIMTEALCAVIRYAFDSAGVNRLEAFHSVRNPASGAVMRKAGMLLEGRARQKYRSHIGYEDCDLYGICRDDLPQVYR